MSGVPHTAFATPDTPAHREGNAMVARLTEPDTYAPGVSCPDCHRRHRTWRAVTECRWKSGLEWVTGNPPASGPCCR